MLEPAAPNFSPGSNISTPSANFSSELAALKNSIEKFKNTGQVDNSELEFAKKEILPKFGLKEAEINDLGPVGIMVKLRDPYEKGQLESIVNGQTVITNQNPIPPLQPKTQSPTAPVQPVSSAPKPTAAPEQPKMPEVDLSSQDIEKLTHDLSNEIDAEIKRQMADKHVLDQAQEEINQVLQSAAKEPLEEKPQEKPAETKPPAEKQVLPKNEPVKASPHNYFENTQDFENIQNLDPLNASIQQALQNLKEGDKIGKEWVLRKILQTSFGNKKAPFYELENNQGAKWTLSPEEMKNVLRTEIESQNQKQSEPVLLSPPPKKKEDVQKAPLHPLHGEEQKEPEEEFHIAGPAENKEPLLKKVTDKVRSGVSAPWEKTKPIVTTPIEKVKKAVTSPAKPIEQHKEEIKPAVKDEPKEEKKIEPIKVELKKPEIKEPPIHSEKPFEKPLEKSSNQDLNQKQIDFINKIHADPSQWRAFISFSGDQWQDVHQMYREGKLINIGIDAHPLIDRLHDPDFGETVEIRKGDSITKILEEAGYNLTWTNQDAKIIGTHLIANHQILQDSRKKLEVSGLTVENLPSEKEVIDLIHGSENGNHQSFYKLQESLQTLPVNTKFKVVKPTQLDELEDFFKK